MTGTMTVYLLGLDIDRREFKQVRRGLSIPGPGEEEKASFTVSPGSVVIGFGLIDEQTLENFHQSSPYQAFADEGSFTVAVHHDAWVRAKRAVHGGRRSARNWHKRIKEVRQYVGLVER